VDNSIDIIIFAPSFPWTTCTLVYHYCLRLA
jgi:hypothetical protein